MRAGLKRDYITIERNNPTQGASGEEIDVWSTLSNAWVFFRGLEGDEAINTYKVSIRYQDVKHTDRIIFGSRIFDIKSVIDRAGMGRELELILVETLN